MESINKEVPHNWQGEIPHDVLALWKCSTLGPVCQETQGERNVAQARPARLTDVSQRGWGGGGCGDGGGKQRELSSSPTVGLINTALYSEIHTVYSPIVRETDSGVRVQSDKELLH